MWYRIKRLKVWGTLLVGLLVVSVALAGCSGPAGPAGPPGLPGPSGPAGAPGKAVTSPGATIVVTPALLKPAIKGVKIQIVGSGFVPGERIEIGLPKALLTTAGGGSPLGLSLTAKGTRTDAYLSYDPAIKVNDQGAFSASVGFGDLTTAEEGTYTLVAIGSGGTLASCPLAVKA